MGKYWYQSSGEVLIKSLQLWPTTKKTNAYSHYIRDLKSLPLILCCSRNLINCQRMKPKMTNLTCLYYCLCLATTLLSCSKPSISSNFYCLCNTLISIILALKVESSLCTSSFLYTSSFLWTSNFDISLLSFFIWVWEVRVMKDCWQLFWQIFLLFLLLNDFWLVVWGLWPFL